MLHIVKEFEGRQAFVVGNQFSAEIMGRILSILETEGNKCKTNLAGLANLNYISCIKYLRFMECLRWIDFGDDDKVSITEEGRKMSLTFKGMSSRTNLAYQESTVRKEEKQRRNYDNKSNQKRINSENGLREGDNPRRVLLVDDENDTLMTYRLFLSDAGFGVRSYTDPEIALRDFAKFEKDYFDFIITDIRMRPINGLQFYKKIRKLNPVIRVIFVSALDAADELLSILPDIEAHQIIRKPIEREQFIKTIEAFCTN